MRSLYDQPAGRSDGFGWSLWPALMTDFWFFVAVSAFILPEIHCPIEQIRYTMIPAFVAENTQGIRIASYCGRKESSLSSTFERMTTHISIYDMRFMILIRRDTVSQWNLQTYAEKSMWQGTSDKLSPFLGPSHIPFRTECMPVPPDTWNPTRRVALVSSMQMSAWPFRILMPA